MSSASAPSAAALTAHRLRWAFGALLLVRLLFPYFNSPPLHLFSDPSRYWFNRARFLDPDPIRAVDPYRYQLWIYLLRRFSTDDPAAVQLVCGSLLCTPALHCAIAGDRSPHL